MLSCQSRCDASGETRASVALLYGTFGAGVLSTKPRFGGEVRMWGKTWGRYGAAGERLYPGPGGRCPALSASVRRPWHITKDIIPRSPLRVDGRANRKGILQTM